MKNITRQVSGLVILASLLAVTPAQAEEQAANAVETIAVAAAQDYVAHHDDAVIMDVRTPVEFDLSHITDAMNVNVQDDDFESMVAGLDRDRTYLVHCTRNPGNGRTSRALETLQSLGFRNLYSLEGGYLAWKDAELPLTEADSP
jgi:rhodanese-related sulfurtransferase